MDSPTTLGARQELIVGKPVYDLAGRLVAVKQYDGTAQTDNDTLTEFTYTYADKTNYLTAKTVELPTHNLTATYTYGDAAVGEMPDQIYNIYYSSWSSVDYAYDALGRLTDETFNVAVGYTIDNSYTYLDVNADRTTTLVSTYTTKTGTYAYTYDAVGNITQIVFTPADTTQSAKTVYYTYDALNRLVRENNQFAGKTYFYTYSSIGNLGMVLEGSYVEPSSVPTDLAVAKSYSYGNSTWRDLLTGFNNKNITYDAIGNPTAIGTANLTWQGRTLTQYADGANTYSYEYDMSGHRISKTVNGVETKYYYDGDQLVAQHSGNDRITFMFDANGSAFGFYYNNAPYFFIKNIQGDVTAITNFAGTVIGTYTYDAWGNLIPEASDLSDEVAAMNPIRYRGYYYDTETGFYYLTTRYYDPEDCRFINADGYISTGQGFTGFNMFAYCLNNPVIYVDPHGNFAIIDESILPALCCISLVINLQIIADYAEKNGGDLNNVYEFVDRATDDDTSFEYMVQAIGIGAMVLTGKAYGVSNSVLFSDIGAVLGYYEIKDALNFSKEGHVVNVLGNASSIFSIYYNPLLSNAEVFAALPPEICDMLKDGIDGLVIMAIGNAIGGKWGALVYAILYILTRD